MLINFILNLVTSLLIIFGYILMTKSNYKYHRRGLLMAIVGIGITIVRILSLN